jgi:hypothetical protein
MNATDKPHDTQHTSRRTLRDSARAQQQSYIRGILAANHGLTVTDIARVTKLSRSTLTRFMNDPEITTVLSGPTIEAIAQAFSKSAGAGGGMAEPEVSPLPPPTPGEDTGLGPNQYDWRIGKVFNGLPGYLPGDFLRVEMGLEPRNGDDVLIQVETRGGATTHLRRFRRNFAFTGHDADPLFVDGERVRVAAVVVKSWREREG